MKHILTVLLALTLTACSQEKVTEVSPLSNTMSATHEEVVEVTVDPVEVEVKKVSKTQIEVKVEKRVETTTAAQPNVDVTPQSKIQTYQEPIIEKREMAAEEKQVVAQPVQAKIVAHPVQGKGEIRKEPKIIPQSGLMLKELSGDAVAGKRVAKKCMSCHTFVEGGKKKMGPNLFAIVGKKQGATAGFKYGSYLADVDTVWDESSLKAWLLDSKGVAKAADKKTKMPSQKIKGEKADDLIAYLKTLK